MKNYIPCSALAEIVHFVVPAFSFVILYIGLISVTNAQTLVQVPCVDGPTVFLDSITFRPDKPFPFDRCFKIVLTVPAKPYTSRFAVTPIGINGESNYRRRDIKVLFKAIYPKKEDREKQKDTWTYKNFKSNPFIHLFKITNSKPKGDKVELTLAIPPLDPRRQYKLTLLNDDDEVFTEFLAISSSVIQSKFLENSGDFAGARVLMEDAKRLYIKSEGVGQLQNGIRFDKKEIDDYPKQLTQLKFYFNLYDKGNVKEYRLFFAPKKNAPILDEKQAAVTKYFVRVQPKIRPNTQSILLYFPIKDIDGNTIAPFQVGEYNIQVLARHLDGGSTLTTLGVLNFSGADFRYNFTPNDRVSDRIYADIDQENVLSHFHKIKTAEKEIGSPQKLTFETHQDVLNFLLVQARSCPCEKNLVKDLTQKDDLMRTISLLYENDSVILAGISNGQRSLTSPDKSVKMENLTQRIDNISVSVAQLKMLIEFARKVGTAYPDKSRDIENLVASITSGINNLTTFSQNITNLIEAKTKLQDEFRFKFGIMQAKVISNGSTSSLSMVSEAKFRIVPDFGFIGIFKGNNAYSFQDFTPYLGFQIGLRPIDKDIPFHLIRNKSILHRLSFMSGVTLTSIKIADKRDDFFAGRSLITGVGVRLTNSFRITSGLVWFRTVNSNPLIDTRPLGFSPFVGLSIDLELQSLFGGIAQIFKL